MVDWGCARQSGGTHGRVGVCTTVERACIRDGWALTAGRGACRYLDSVHIGTSSCFAIGYFKVFLYLCNHCCHYVK
jgi:hypothetical protein